MFVTPGSRARRKRTSGVSAPLALNFGTITANPAEPTPGMALSIYGTWNNSGVVFDAPLFMNVTNTASAAGSRLIDIQIGAALGLAYTTGGILQLADIGGLINPDLRFVVGGSQSIDIQSGSLGQLLILVTNNRTSFLTSSEFRLSGAQVLSWESTTDVLGGANDTALFRDAATSVLALGNKNSGTTATGFRVYNTTDNVGTGSAPTNYERGILDWTVNSNVLAVGTQRGGTGTSRIFGLMVGNSYFAGIDTGGNMGFGASGSLTAGATTFTGCSVAISNFQITLINSAVLGWSNAASFASNVSNGDTGIHRNAPAVMYIDKGTTATPTGSLSTTVWQQHHANYGGI